MGAISSFVQPLGLVCLVPFVLLWILIRLKKKKKGAIYFELAPWSSMRLCLQLEKTFPDLRGWQVELMKQLCLVAYNSEIYDAVGREGWLRTTVTLPQLESDLDSCIFSEESAECDVMRRIAELYSTINARDFETSWRELRKLHRELVTRVKIHSNIIPREASREKLSEVLHRQQHGSSPSRTFRREFHPIGVLADAVEESTSVSEKTKEWRRNGGQCVLARHLHTRNVPHAAPRPAPWPAPRNRLRVVMQKEVHTIRNLKSGAVQEVSWRNGIYARKKFDQAFTPLYVNERDVALRVCHPHVIRPIGQTIDADGKPCLLMELLQNDLCRLSIEKDFEGGENPLFEGSVESLDVLLQIARGLKSLHDAHVVHGDLKPQNIFFSHFEISEDVWHVFVKVADFDNAKVVSSPVDFEPSFGTTQYAAPEVLKWKRLNEQDNRIPFCDLQKPDVDSLPYKLDIYSFGCIAYEVLTGHEVYGVKVHQNLKEVVKGTLIPNGAVNFFPNMGYRPSFMMAFLAIIRDFSWVSFHSAKRLFGSIRKYIVWQNLKMTYPPDFIHCLESCWAVNPSERPSSSKLCEVLEKSKAEMQHRVTEIRNLQEAWKERGKCAFRTFLVTSLIVFICCFAASYINLDAKKFWSWLANLAVNRAAVALVGFVCICCHIYFSEKLKRD